MTEQELREQLRMYLKVIAENWNDYGKNLTASPITYDEAVRVIMSYVKDDANYVRLADDQSLPEIPGFQYDPEEYRPWLKRGAINYSKMLSHWRKVELGGKNGN